MITDSQKEAIINFFLNSLEEVSETKNGSVLVHLSFEDVNLIIAMNPNDKIVGVWTE